MKKGLIIAKVLILKCFIITAQVNINEVIVPKGVYDMGDHFGFVDPGHPSDEVPIHSVKVDSFYIAKYETTNQQFLTFLQSLHSAGTITVANNKVYPITDTAFYYFTNQFENWYSIGYSNNAFSIALPSENITTSSFIIYYGVENVDGFSIPDEGLLWENGVSEKDFRISLWKNVPTIFHSKNDCSLPFDIFSAVFFLLSRYEEYLPFSPDKHARFPHTQSILFQNGWLQRPLIDEWILQLKISLEKHFDCTFNLPAFSFTPTYDIDIAYSYKHKGFVRWWGAFAKDLLKGNFSSLSERFRVALGFAPDPFDCFDWLKKTHKQLQLHPTYFILAAQKNTAFDKNNLPSNPAMKSLIASLATEGTIGMHPSYFSQEKNIFQEEKKLLETFIGKEISFARQHYIRLQIPKTYRYLIAQGIKEDFSMGYGAALGFRAGTGRSFYWFDLEKNEQTDLRVHPFCFMDSTAHYEEKMSAQEAEKTLLDMLLVLQKTNSQMLTVFHNFSLGSAPEWKGWREVYFSFLKRC